jgi:hypothetical protein
MLAMLGVMSVTGGTCLACGATETRYEKQIDILSGVLLVAGLSMIGALFPAFH